MDEAVRGGAGRGAQPHKDNGPAGTLANPSGLAD